MATAMAMAMAMATGNTVRRYHGTWRRLPWCDADGGNSGVTIVGRASLAAGGGLIINSIVNLLSTL